MVTKDSFLPPPEITPEITPCSPHHSPLKHHLHVVEISKKKTPAWLCLKKVVSQMRFSSFFFLQQQGVGCHGELTCQQQHEDDKT